jgi:hypothetical protein
MNQTLTSNKELAMEILSQLGGRQFIAMTGCKNLVYDHNSLTMKLVPNRSKAKYLQITLNEWDTYNLIFFTVNKQTGERIYKQDVRGIYCDNLRMVFENETGLYTKLF